MLSTSLLSAFILLLSLGASPLALGGPVDTGFKAVEVHEARSPDPHSPTITGLQLREDGDEDKSCSTVENIIDKIGTSKAVCSYATFGGYTTRYICERYNWRDCDRLVGVIASGIVAIYNIVYEVAGAIHPQPRGLGEDATPAHELLAQGLRRQNIEFQDITDSTDGLHPLYAEGDRKPVSISSIHGVRHFDDNAPVNMDVYHFDDGEGHIHLPHDALEQRTDTSIHARMSKRLEHAPGFKISYTTRNPSKLTKAHQRDMANAIAKYWSATAAGSKMHDMIGFVETEKVANFYFRIIPETEDFGLNYETVDSCGEMKDML